MTSLPDFLYEYELGKAADVLVRELFKLKEGETFVITGDTLSDPRVVNATARAAYAVGAKPMVIWTCTPPGPGRQIDAFIPSEAIHAATAVADAWVEFNEMYYLYSATHDKTMHVNKKMRFLGLPAMHVDTFVRLFANVDHRVLAEFLQEVTDRTRKTKHMRITTPSGQDVEFDNKPEWPAGCENGYCDTPGIHMLAGQIGWSPDFDTINGVIVFDGSLVPQYGILTEPIRLTVEKGVILKIEGGRQAKQLESFLKSFNHPQMLRLAHVCYGFHPGAKVSGQLGEDERVWGCTQWGIGAVGTFLAPPDGVPGPSHIDGTCLNSSVYLDGVQLTDCGRLIDPQLIEMAAKLGMR